MNILQKTGINFVNSSVFLISFLAGVLSFKLFECYFLLNFDFEINVLDLLELILTLTLGLYISVIIDKRKNQDSIEKEFILNEVYKIRQFINNIDEAVETDNLVLSEIVKNFKFISHSLSSIEDFSTKLDIKVKEEIDCVKKRYSTIKSLVTGSSTSDNKFKMTEIHKGQFLTEQKEFNIDLISLLIKINHIK